jgi:hypothetical protein
MSDTIECPSCMRQYRWKPELAGKRAKCKCGGRVTFPATSPAAVAIAAPLADDGDDAGVGVSAPDNEPGDEAAAALAALSAGEKNAAAQPTVQLGYNFCPKCNNRLSGDVVLCVRCGYNSRTGRTMSTTVKTGPDAAEVAVATGIVAARIVLSMVVGGIVAILGAVGWIAMIVITGYQIGFLAWLLGLLVGLSMRLVNPRGGDMPGMAAGAFAFLSLGLAKGVLVAIAHEANIPVAAVLSPLDFLWFFIAVSAAYKLARG